MGVVAVLLSALVGGGAYWSITPSSPSENITSPKYAQAANAALVTQAVLPAAGDGSLGGQVQAVPAAISMPLASSPTPTTQVREVKVDSKPERAVPAKDEVAKAERPVSATKKPKRTSNPVQPDSDVALVSALMTHLDETNLEADREALALRIKSCPAKPRKEALACKAKVCTGHWGKVETCPRNERRAAERAARQQSAKKSTQP
ncbi:hypothetical protein ACG0Z6_02675 [Roseateles sp. BYS180W]|uniref:Uncharacterized protein n=1 Tax=Roseateles rivi TaxID=3299028 RepID=A0ABW7FS34_9BURK